MGKYSSHVPPYFTIVHIVNLNSQFFYVDSHFCKLSSFISTIPMGHHGGENVGTHGIVCWRCDYKFEVAVSLPKNAKKKNRVYSKWDSVKSVGMRRFDETEARLHKEARVYVDYEDPIKEEDDLKQRLRLTGTRSGRTSLELRTGQEAVPYRRGHQEVGEDGRTRGSGRSGSTTKMTTGPSR